MIEGDKFIALVKDDFGFLLTEFAFTISNETKVGNAFYEVQFKDASKIISVSYENIEDYFLVIVHLLQNGRLPDYDDKSKTLHLNALNAKLLSKIDRVEIEENNRLFAHLNAEDGFERKVLKAAKDLRLCLKHIDALNA